MIASATQNLESRKAKALATHACFTDGFHEFDIPAERRRGAES